MVKLSCTVVGWDGDVFGVHVDEGDSMMDLKEKIKNKHPNGLQGVSEDQMRLFLPKKADGSLLADDSVGSLEKALSRGEMPTEVADIVNVEGNALHGSKTVKEVFGASLPRRFVHMLVQTPHPSWTVKIAKNDAFEKYEKTAELLKHSDKVEEVVETLDRVKQHRTRMPFVILENSSGTGKTQMAFNLQANGTFDVFYVLCTSWNEREQDVYNAFDHRTTAFLACIQSDTATMEEGSVAEFKKTENLQVYRFILAVLRGETSFIGEASRETVAGEVGCRTKACVFFLDEFPRLKSDEKQEEWEQREKQALAMRNVFRSFGIPIMISSTNDTARRCPPASKRSRAFDLLYRDESPWCVVIPSLPPFDINGMTDEIYPEKPFKWILQHSRPLFGVLALRYMRENPRKERSELQYLTAMTDALAKQLRLAKERSHPEEFNVGQFCMFMASSYELPPTSEIWENNTWQVVFYNKQKKSEDTNLIDYHYDRLEEDETFELMLGAGNLWKNEEGWRCRYVLPLPKNDMLLHLTLTGDHQYTDEYGESQCVFPLALPLYKVMQSGPVRNKLSYRNSAQKASDGTALEALVAGAVVLASHHDGFGGVKFPVFFGRLLYELGVRDVIDPVELPDDDGNNDIIIPFLAAPSVEWPAKFVTYWNTTGARFANVQRAHTGEAMTLRTDVNILSGKCEDKFDLSTVKDVFGRVPDSTKVHLVVVKSMQKENIALPSELVATLKENHLQHAKFYRISRENQTLERFPMLKDARKKTSSEQTPTGGAGKAIVFVEVGEWDSKRALESDANESLSKKPRT